MKLKKDELKKINGGAVSSVAINALMRTVSVMFSMGQAVGSAIKRALNGSYSC